MTLARPQAPVTVPFVEGCCSFLINGQRVDSGGAAVTEQAAIAYLGRRDGRLVVTTWAGDELGSARITSTWKTPRSYMSSTMHQVEATISGRRYTGRSAGEGMIWKGRAVK